ncbi:fimbrial protein [Klebsiella pneumoniae]|uniref:fimbrial protein n=1 Tax=Klebsiella pneumoniae TaxID=573 RepID=UPI0039B5978B
MTQIKQIYTCAGILRGTLIALILLAWQSSQQAFADATISFSGTLVSAPNCTVNTNNAVDVDFGDDLITRRIDGVNYRKAIEYTLVCSSVASSGMKIAITGTTAAFGTGLIKTDKTGLGLQIYRGSDKVSNGVSMNFTYPDSPVLYAVPVAKDASTLTAGIFTGTASMVISYQ